MHLQIAEEPPHLLARQPEPCASLSKLTNLQPKALTPMSQTLNFKPLNPAQARWRRMWPRLWQLQPPPRLPVRPWLAGWRPGECWTSLALPTPCVPTAPGEQPEMCCLALPLCLS